MVEASLDFRDSGTGTDSFRAWSFPADLPKFCGPKELARIIEDFRSWEDKGERRTAFGGLSQKVRGHVAGAPLEDVLSLAYTASFLKDEGRYTRAQLFFAGDLDPRPRKIVAFQDPLVLAEANQIKLLGPTLTSDAYALALREQSGTIVCDGIYLMDEYRAVAKVPDVSLRHNGVHHGLAISVRDPGELTVSEGPLRFKLHANQLANEGDVPFAPLVWDWLDSQMTRIFTACSSKDKEGMSKLTIAPIQEVFSVWSRVLTTAKDLKHGGCFVVLEQMPTPYIDFKFPTKECSLGEQLENYWLASANATRLKDQAGFAEVVKEFNRQRHLVLSTIHAVGSLSATDGCVGLDRELKVHGFGGNIFIPPGSPAPARSLVNWETKLPIDETQVVEKRGTRHKSAFQLCKYLGNTIAFVISQDGEVSVFSSDSDHVYLRNRLTVP